MPSSSSGAMMAKTGTSPAPTTAGTLPSETTSIRDKTVFAGIERRHATGEFARKAGSIGIANRQDKVHAFVGRQGHSFVDQLVSPVALNRAAAEKHALEQSSIKRAECRRDKLIARMLFTAQHDQRLGATVVSYQSSAPASHVSIRNKARRHTKPIIDHLSHNPSVRIGGINR